MCAERFELFDPGFSTADAEYPSIELRSGDVTLDFLDWQNRPVRVYFHDVAGFRWDDEPDLARNNLRDDACASCYRPLLSASGFISGGRARQIDP